MINNIHTLELDQYKENILIGSVLGDGSLSKYGRSKNALYREHGTTRQNGYRAWKAQHLNLKFIKEKGKIYSRSLPLYTKYYNMFYFNRVKTITKENIKLLSHPVGLMCLYFDDGSLVINKDKRKNGVHIYPIIYLYSQSFSLEENIILKDHIKKTFNIEFILKKIKNGTGYCLNLNKRNEIVHMLSIIKPYATDIKCMQYKVDLEYRLNQYKKENPGCFIDSLTVTDHTYSKEDVKYIIEALERKDTQHSIADHLGRSYWGVVDKIRRLRKECKL